MTAGGGLRGGELLFDALLAQSADPVLLSRLDGTVLRANAAACAVLGRLEADRQALGSRAAAAQPLRACALLQRVRDEVLDVGPTVEM